MVNEQQQPPDGYEYVDAGAGMPMGYGTGAQMLPQDITPSLVREINPSKVVGDLKHFFRGEEFDDENRVWKKVRDPYMNEKGINSVFIEIMAAANQNVTLSIYDEETIAKITIQLGDSLIWKIAYNRVEFGIKSKMDMTGIVLNSVVQVNACLRRAYKNAEKAFLRTSSTEQRIFNTSPGLMQQQQKGGGLFKAIFGGKNI